VPESPCSAGYCHYPHSEGDAVLTALLHPFVVFVEEGDPVALLVLEYVVAEGVSAGSAGR